MIPTVLCRKLQNLTDFLLFLVSTLKINLLTINIFDNLMCGLPYCSYNVSLLLLVTNSIIVRCSSTLAMWFKITRYSVRYKEYRQARVKIRKLVCHISLVLRYCGVTMSLAASFYGSHSGSSNKYTLNNTSSTEHCLEDCDAAHTQNGSPIVPINLRNAFIRHQQEIIQGLIKEIQASIGEPL